MSRALSSRATIEGPIGRGEGEASDHPRNCDLPVVEERAVPVRPMSPPARNQRSDLRHRVDLWYRAPGTSDTGRPLSRSFGYLPAPKREKRGERAKILQIIDGRIRLE